MLRTVLSVVVLLSAIITHAPAVSAQASLSVTPWTEVHASRVRLVAGRARTEAGHYLAAVEIVLADGWKTYWRMPGDSGVPPNFDWAGSGNVAATKVLYPAPLRMPEAGGVAIGYKRAVLLPIEVTPQDPSKPVVLKLSLEFGVCREICIPAMGNFDLSIPAAATGAPAPEIAAAIERVPRNQDRRRKGDPELKRVTLNGSGPSSKLTIEAAFAGNANSADAFIEAPEGYYVSMPTRVAADARGVVRFETEIGRDLAQDLKGKTLILTLVSDAGAMEAPWIVP